MTKAMPQDIFLDRAVITHNHDGEGLCGDFYGEFGSAEHPVAVLSDGMGSGVKANIMSTITSTILGRLLEHGLPLAECVDTIAASLPLCKERGMAYATFTAAQIRGDQLFLVEYGNPPCILFRGGKALPTQCQVRFVGDKEIHERTLRIQSGDLLLMMSDGVTHAGIGVSTIDGWSIQEIGDFLSGTDLAGNCAAVTAALLDERCNTMSDGQFGDDRTIAVMRFCPHSTANIVMGPPARGHDEQAALRLFFSKRGKHIVCGGTTSQIVANYLGKPLELIQGSGDADVPDMGRIEGVDLTTEGIITLQHTLALHERIAADPDHILHLGQRPDELLYRALFMESTNINIFFGTAFNDAHSGTNIAFDNKITAIKTLCRKLEEAGKKTSIQYY